MRISDWSSDVCSSDLQGGRDVAEAAPVVGGGEHPEQQQRGGQHGNCGARIDAEHGRGEAAERLVAGEAEVEREIVHHLDPNLGEEAELEIGRASCRERECMYV